MCRCFSLFFIVFANGFDCIFCSRVMWEQTVLYTDCLREFLTGLH